MNIYHSNPHHKADYFSILIWCDMGGLPLCVQNRLISIQAEKVSRKFIVHFAVKIMFLHLKCKAAGRTEYVQVKKQWQIMILQPTYKLYAGACCCFLHEHHVFAFYSRATGMRGLYSPLWKTVSWVHWTQRTQIKTSLNKTQPSEEFHMRRRIQTQNQHHQIHMRCKSFPK